MTQTEKEALRDYIVSYLIANSQTINGLPDVTSLDGISSFPVVQQQEGNKYIAKKVPFNMMITEFRYNSGYIQYKDLINGTWINIMSFVELAEELNLSRYVNVDMDQIVNGIKTFNNSPIVPDPITSQQVTNKGYVDSSLLLKVDKTSKIISGDGLIGGGDLSSDLTINIESANDGILINPDNIQLQTVDNLNGLSSNKPLSSLQGKILNETKIDIDGLNSNISKLHFNTDTLSQLTNIGDVRYSPESKTIEVKVSDAVSLQLGQEMQIRVKNDEVIQINNGQMVYINSAVGANPLAKLASTSNADVAQKTFGMATENIPANGFGAITTEGLVRDINTSAFPEGSMLWLGTNGSVTNIEPTAPTSKISIGMVLRSNANNGVVYVKIRAIERSQKLSDVYAPTLTSGDILRWNGTAQRFETYNLSNKADLVDGKVMASQLPSYVDDVLEYANFAAFPVTGESGKIYVDLQYNLVYRWSGSIYTEISKSLALGETSNTAFRGDYGQAAYQHANTDGNPHNTVASEIGNTPTGGLSATTVQGAINELDSEKVGKTTKINGYSLNNDINLSKSDVGLGNVDNTSDINKPISTNQQTALNAKVDKTIIITAGAGLTGGGDLSSNKTINIASANDGITVNADDIQLNTIDNLTATSTTKPLSANQGNVLNEKVAQVESKLSLYSLKTEIPDLSGFSKNEDLALKVDKITGKGLSTNDYTTEEKNKLQGISSNANNYVHPSIHSADILVDGTTNKVFTATEKTKLSGIATGAQVNVQSDWNAASGDAFILNKPTTVSGYGITDTYTKTEVDNKLSTVYKYKGVVATSANLPSTGMVVGDVWNVTDTNINHAWDGSAWDPLGGVVGADVSLATPTTDGLLSASDFVKLSGIAVGAEVNVNPDWNAVSGDAQILNKPTTITGYGITDAYTKTQVDTSLSGKEPTITAGTTTQYWRGDKSWQTLNKAAIGLSSVENTALSTWAGSTNISTVGTITNGTWSGSAIGISKGGTNLTALGTANQLLRVNASATALEYFTPAWPSVSFGEPTAQYSPLTINSVTRNLSLDGHTHNYLPLSGGNLSGDLRVNARFFINSDEHHLFYNSAIGCISSKYGFAVGNYYVWHAGNFNPSSYLPLSGGTLTGQFNLSRVGLSTDNFINFVNDTQTTRIGIRNPYSAYGLTFVDPNNNYYKIWHEGNSNFAEVGHTHSYIPLASNIYMGSKDLYFNAADSGDIVFSDSALNQTGRIWHDGISLKISGTSGTSTNLLSIGGSIFKYNNNTIWHAGNDGAGSGLDADMLDGFHNTSFFKTRIGQIANINDQALVVDNSTCCWVPDTIGRPSNSLYGVLMNISDNATWYNQFGFATNNNVYFRQSIDSATNFTNWRKLAFEDSNVASATKLATTRTIWGQSFNGEGNVDGQLSLLQGTNGGLIFPNDSFGGGGDSASIKLLNPAGGEATEMTFTMTNDADDIINFNVPSIDGVKVNRYTVWNAGNFTNLNQLTTRNFNDLQNKPTTLSGYGITDSIARDDRGYRNIIANNISYSVYGFGYSQDGFPTSGSFISFGGLNNRYVTQIQGDYGGAGMYYRTRNDDNGTWNSWHTILDDVNAYTKNSADNTFLKLAGGTVIGQLWASYGSTAMSGYSWTDSAFTTNSIEIVNSNGASNTSPTLAFHRWGYGGPQFRLDGSGTCILYLESAGAGSARNPNSQGTTYFASLRLNSSDANGIYVNGNKVWHSGNDGSGSGLDADLIDGINSNNIVYGTNGYACNNIINADFNTINKSGLYTIYGGANSPTGSNQDKTYSLLSILEGSLTGSQLAYSFYGSDSGNLYVRGALGGSFSAWRKIWHEGNDGAGSGLDADLLDGLHGSEYLKKYPTGVGAGVELDLNNCSGVNILSGYNVTNSPYTGDVSILTIPIWNGGGKYSTQFVFGMDTTVNPYFRRTNVNGEGTWKQLAFLTDNVASATKLANTRTIWGQSFNGEGNVSGAINNAFTGTFSSYVTANRFYTGYDANTENSFSCSNWFRSSGATGWFNETYGAGINSDTANVVRTYSTNKFKVYNAEWDSISTYGGIYAYNWFRSNGDSGWYNQTYGGGINMENSDSVNIVGNKVLFNQGYRQWGIGGHRTGLKLYDSYHIGINLATDAYTWGIYANSNGNMYFGRRSGNINDGSGTYYLTLRDTSLTYAGEIISNTHLTTTGAANATGHFGSVSSTWGNTGGYPTLFSNAADRWIMHINPHISYIQNGVGGYTGSLTGARVRFASDTAASNYWDLGIGVNNVGADKFSVGRYESSFVSIDNTGNVGIGTTSPSYKLDVSGSGHYASELYLDYGLRISNAAGAGLGISLFNESSFNPNFGLMFAQTVYKGTHGSVTGGWATYFTMSQDVGRGWIFTSNAAGTGGNVASISNTGNLYCTGSGTFTGGGFNSLRNLKIIHDDWYGSSIEVINKFKIRDFNYKNQVDYNRTLGFIIDEVPVEVADYVLMGENRDSVNLYSLHALSFKAHQETKSEIDLLKEKIKELNNRIKILENGLE